MKSCVENEKEWNTLGMADNMKTSDNMPKMTGHVKRAIFHTFWDHPILTQEVN